MNDELLNKQVKVIISKNCLPVFVIWVPLKKVFWRKVLDVYTTSIDYNPKTEVSMLFFQTVQNKMHWAAHGHTAAEIIYQRIDATKANSCLTNIKGTKPTKQEIEIAKNYLDENELNQLNKMVFAYLELAELQPLNRRRIRNFANNKDHHIRS